jgi:hypothetical protein
MFNELHDESYKTHRYKMQSYCLLNELLQVVSRQLLIVEGPVRSQDSACGICGG